MVAPPVSRGFYIIAMNIDVLRLPYGEFTTLETAEDFPHITILGVVRVPGGVIYYGDDMNQFVSTDDIISDYQRKAAEKSGEIKW